MDMEECYIATCANAEREKPELMPCCGGLKGYSEVALTNIDVAGVYKVSHLLDETRVYAGPVSRKKYRFGRLSATMVEGRDLVTNNPRKPGLLEITRDGKPILVLEDIPGNPGSL